MDVFPAETKLGGYDQALLVEDTDKDDDEEEKDLCRICRSPEKPGNPLRYPCSCRGSMKFVHQDCIHLWINRRGCKQCEVCRRNYSFVPVYSENAPKRLPCHEFLLGVLLRASPYVRITVPWVVAFLLNTFCFSLHPWGQAAAAEHQRAFGLSWKSACLLNGLTYNLFIVYLIHMLSLVRMFIEEPIGNRFPGVFHVEILIGHALGHGALSRVALVIWKYMKIIRDWCHSQLDSFLGEHPRLVGVALHEFEFGVIGRVLLFLDKNAFLDLTISIYMSFLSVLLPFSIGWIVLATVGGSYLSDISPVILGYMVMLSISFGYLGIFFTLRQNSLPAIVRWISFGFHFIAVEFPCLLWVSSITICKNLFVVMKGTFVLGLKIGVFPWIIGCWLDICTFSMSGTTMSNRIEILTEFPFLMIIHWAIGFFCLLIAFNFMNLIQEIIQKRAFWFLLDITDPRYKMTNLNLGQTLFAFAFHGVLLVFLFHLPIKAITFISPSFLPLDFWVYNYDARMIIFYVNAYYWIIIVGMEWFDRDIRPAFKPIALNWIITVSSWLQLSEFLLLVPQGEGFQNVRPFLQQVRQLDDNPWLLVKAVAEGSVVNLYGSENVENDIGDQRDNRFMLRITMLLILAVLTLFLASTTFMALPILLGRAFFYAISFIRVPFKIKHDDLYAFWIGIYIPRAVYISFCFVLDHIWRGRTDLLIKYIMIWIRNVLFFSIWITVIPGLLGLLIDLMIIIPLRVPLDESPIYLLIQDWLIGVVVLHIWTFLTMRTPINCLATKAWREKFKRIKNVGINRLPTLWLLRDVICSIINSLLTTLCIPYLLVKSLLPLLGYSQSDNAAVERLIWPALLALITVWFIARQSYDFIVYLRQLVFDDRYVVGERVDDLSDDLEQGLIHGV